MLIPALLLGENLLHDGRGLGDGLCIRKLSDSAFGARGHAGLANRESWAARIRVPAYAIDDQTAIKVVDGIVEVVSQGNWKLFTP